MSDDQKPSNVEASLIQTLQSSEVSDIVKDTAEIGIDMLLDNEILKQVPIVNWVFAIGKTATAVRDYLLIQKIVRFLAELSQVPKEERDSFITKIEEENKYGHHVAETIMMLLDRCDHIDKASVVAKLFCAYGRGQIDYNHFLRLSAAVDRAFMPDLQELLDYFSGKEITSDQVKRNLYPSGLADFYALSPENQWKAGLEHPQVYHFNPLAKKLAQCVLGERCQRSS